MTRTSQPGIKAAFYPPGRDPAYRGNRAKEVQWIAT
jgi:hypothetical protein